MENGSGHPERSEPVGEVGVPQGVKGAGHGGIMTSPCRLGKTSQDGPLPCSIQQRVHGAEGVAEAIREQPGEEPVHGRGEVRIPPLHLREGGPG
jgi:hypothetical protein